MFKHISLTDEDLTTEPILFEFYALQCIIMKRIVPTLHFLTHLSYPASTCYSPQFLCMNLQFHRFS